MQIFSFGFFTRLLPAFFPFAHFKVICSLRVTFYAIFSSESEVCVPYMQNQLVLEVTLYMSVRSFPTEFILRVYSTTSLPL